MYVLPDYLHIFLYTISIYYNFNLNEKKYLPLYLSLIARQDELPWPAQSARPQARHLARAPC